MTPPHIVPEWYYLPFYAILRAIPNKLLGVHRAVRLDRDPGVPALARHLARALGAYRPLFRQFFWLFVVVCLGLGWLGSKPAEGIYVVARAHPHLLLLRALPRRPAAARHDREAEAAAEFDLGIGAGCEGVSGGIDMKRTTSSLSRSPARWSARWRRRRREEHGAPQPPRAEVVVRRPVRQVSTAAQLQRGFKVYKRGLPGLPPTELCWRSATSPTGGPGLLRGAGERGRRRIQGQGGLDDQGEMFERAGRPADHFPSPFANDKAAARRQWRRRAARHVGARQGAHL